MATSDKSVAFLERREALVQLGLQRLLHRAVEVADRWARERGARQRAVADDKVAQHMVRFSKPPFRPSVAEKKGKTFRTGCLPCCAVPGPPAESENKPHSAVLHG